MSTFSTFESELKWLYRLTPEDVEPTNVRGYWRIKKPCGGRAGGCRNQIHGTMFNEGSMHHTVRFTDPIRGKDGRWTSPYRTWREHRRAS